MSNLHQVLYVIVYFSKLIKMGLFKAHWNTFSNQNVSVKITSNVMLFNAYTQICDLWFDDISEVALIRLIRTLFSNFNPQIRSGYISPSDTEF